MTKALYSIKAKFAAVTAIIVVLFLVSYIFIYNNNYFSGDIVKQATILKNIRLYPEIVQNKFNNFIYKEVSNPILYQKEKTLLLDSLKTLSQQHLYLLDSVKNLSYYQNKSVQNSINGLKADITSFNVGNDQLLKLIIDRGYIRTGKAGEWTRQGEFTEGFIVNLKNPELLKSWVDIRKNESRYMLQFDRNAFDQLSDLVVAFRSDLASRLPKITSGVSETDRLKLLNETEKYLDFAIVVRNKDKAIGFGSNEGLIGSQLLTINTIEEKSQELDHKVLDALNQDATNSFIFRTLILLLLITGVLYLIRKYYVNLQNSIQSIIHYLEELVKGRLPEPLDIQTTDEISQIASLTNQFVAGLHNKVKFAQELGKGEESTNTIQLSNEDSLANALLDLKVSLRKAEEEDSKYKAEEKKRTWSNEGLTKFSEILRFQTSDISELSDMIITHLVKYLNAIQGGIFMYVENDFEEPYLEIVSAFAYDRKKYISKRVNLGEGLIGTCALEKLTIYMTDIPEDYVTITSGLGDAPPRCLLIVPLKTEEKIYGILEITSFQNFEKHELEFVEKLAESIASTYATLKINIHTTKLLEQSKKQAEEMAQQEEEMRQNLEELQATQEDSARKEAEIASIISALETSSLVMELDMEGKIITANSKYCAVLHIQREDIVGKNLRAICFFDPQSEEYGRLWGELRNGRSMIRDEEIHYNNKKYFFTHHYSPIFDQDRNPYKVLVLALDKTGYIYLENNINQITSELDSHKQHLFNLNQLIDKALIFAELSPDGTILKANQNYQQVTGYMESEIVDKNARFFLKPEELKQFELIWSEVAKGKSHSGVVRRTKPTGEEYWLMSSAIPVKGANDTIEKVYFVAQDITEKKLKYQVLEEANKEIERLKALVETHKEKE